MSTTTPTALVVYESMFGNTDTIARAIANGLAMSGWQVELAEVSTAPRGDAVRHHLVVAGAPTHAFSLSRASTRAEAVRRGGMEDRGGTGLREWIADLPKQPVSERPLAAVFDTRVSKVRRLPMNAATRAAHLMHAHGYSVLAQPAGFVVVDTSGPLGPGEITRATAWGDTIGHLAARRLGHLSTLPSTGTSKE